MRGSPVWLFPLILLLLSYHVQGQVSPVTCKSLSKDGSFCKECRDYYHLYEGQCFVNILGCESYVFGNICRKCEKGFILVNNQCCDKVCMSKVYRQEHHASKVAQNREEELRKAEVDGLEKSIAVVAKNSVKTGQDYDILGTRSQRFQKVFRYFVDLEVQGHQYTATNDYNIVTGEVQFVSVVPKGEPAPSEVTLTQENIHGNAIYEEGYKFVYEKYGLELYELQFSRMSAVQYARSTELRFVFLGTKVLLVTIMMSQDGPYILWKQERTNVQEVKEYIDNLKKVESVTKEYNFKQVLSAVLAEKKYKENEIEVVEATPISQEEYIFIIYHRVYRIRFRIRGRYSVKMNKVSLDQVEEVFSEKLTEMKEPEQPKTKVIAKQSLSKSVEAKEVFDYLYKIQPTFRQNLVETIQVEEGKTIKKLFVLTKKDGKNYRLVVLKDQKTQTLQLVDEGFVIDKQPTATVINPNQDGTTTVITSNIDPSKPQVQTLITALNKNGIDTKTTKLESMQYTETTKTIEYVAVLTDSQGKAVRQVTISQDKQTKEMTLIDSRALEPEESYVKPIENPSVVIPPSDYFKPQVKELISKVEVKVQTQVTISKVNKITVTNTTKAQKYEMLVEDNKGKIIQIAAIQVKGQAGIEVLRVTPYQEAETITTQTKVVKKVDQFGVRTQYTNDQRTLTQSQNINAAVTTLVSQEPELANYKVISAQTKDYLQQQQQILILSNGTRSVQVLGHVDQKTMRYVLVEEKEIPVSVTYPVITQQTVLPAVYPVAVKAYKPLQESEVTLHEKYKIFKNKVPILTTVQVLEKVEIITFSYEINQKKFIAVIQYDKTGKETQIVQVSPIEVTVKPAKVDQTTYEGKTVTTSNSVQEIQKINENTENVITTVLKDYPLLKNQNITEVTLTQSDFSDVYEITYTETKTKEETTITVRTDKKAEKVTIEDVWSEGELIETVKVVEPPKVVLKEEDFKSQPVKKVVEAVNKTKVPVDKVIKVVTEKSPSYTTYNMEVQSQNKSYEVTVIDHNQTQEVVSIRSPEKKITVPVKVKPAVVKEVDNKGNQVVKTNDINYITTTMTEVTTVVEHIKTIHQETTSWHIDSVITVDYGTVEGVTVTLLGTQPEDALTTTVFYTKETKQVQVISVEKVTVQVQKPKEVFYGEITPVVYPTVTIPDVAIPVAIKKDKALSSVITYVQGSTTVYQNVLPVTTQVQQLSKTKIQYSVVMQVEEKKEQVVVIYDSTTQESKIITSNEVKIDVKPYYVTQVETEAGQAVESNSVEEITVIQPEFPQVLEYCNQWLQTNKDWSEVEYIQVIPSTVKGGSTVYTLETSTTTEKKKIEVSYNTVTKEMTVIDLQVNPAQIVYPSVRPVIKIDPKKDTEEIKEYTQLIETSKKTTVEVVKEVVSVSKVVTESEETIRTEVIGGDNKKYYVTIVKKSDEEPEVVNVEGGEETEQKQAGAVVESVDSNGNSVKEITGVTIIQKQIQTSTSIQVIKKVDTKLINYVPISAKTIDLGPKDEVTVILKDKQTDDIVQATTIYDEETNEADVVSIIQKKVPVGIIPAEEEKLTVEQVTKPEEEVLVPQYPTKNIPQILVPEVIKTDKSLETVIKTVQQSDVSYQNVVPLSVEVQSYTKQVFKYTVIMEVQDVKKQIVTIYNATSTQVRPISVTVLAPEVKPTYNQEIKTQTGEIIYSSNNITKLMTKFTDLKFVYEETVKLVPEIDPEQISIAVIPQDSINSYTIQTVKGNNKVTVELNYDVVSNRTYVTNYKVEPITVTVPTKPKYYPEVLKVDDKVKYIETVKNSGIKEITETINVIESKTTEYALYKETVLKIETKEDKTYYVKVIKENEEEQPKVIDVTEVPEVLPEVQTREDQLVIGEVQQHMGEDQTTIKTDTNGNIVTISTDEIQIVKNPAVNASVVKIIKDHPEYSGYNVKYVKTVNFGLMEEVMTTMFNPSTGVIDLQAISFYNKETKIPQIVSVEPIKQPTIEEPAIYKPLYPSVVISDSALTSAIRKDVGLRSVLQAIQKSSVHYHTAIPLTVQVQKIGLNTFKYVVILQVAGQKEQKVYTYNKESNQTQHYATTIVPSVIVPKITTQTVVENKKVTISNSVQQIEQSYPETTKAVTILTKEKPHALIESVMVVPQSNTTEVTLISKNSTTKEYIVEKYATTSESVTKVEDKFVKIVDVAVPKPIIYTPVAPVIITENPLLQSEVKKIINVDATTALQTTKITSVTVSQNTNIQVYEIKATDATDKPVSIEIIYNPATEQTTVVDVSEVKTQKKITTTTITKETSGVSDVTTTDTEVIKKSKQYTQITDFLKKNHPDVDATVVEPIVEQTETYQRSVIKTVILKEKTKTIQATYVINQRTQTVTELSYEELPLPEEPIIDLPVKPIDIVYKPVIIPEIVKKEKIIIQTITSINKVDPTLKDLTPTFVEVKEYKGYKVITIVYDTPKSNSRLLTIYNQMTGEANVVDYTKIDKAIQGSKTVQTINELGQKTYYTDTVTTTITESSEYVEVMTVADELVPSIKNKPILGFETSSKSTGVLYKIVAVQNGVISQVTLQFNNKTKEAVLISETETSIATEISKITKKVETKPKKIDLETLQGEEVAVLIDQVVIENPVLFDKTAPIISGSVVQTDFAIIYELTLETKTEVKQTVKITKEKKTNKLMVNDIHPVIIRPALPPVTTVTQTDDNGNVQKITNDKVVIKESKEIQKVIDYVYKEKPQLAVLVPTTTKTVTYGDIIEDTVVFTGKKQSTVQVTTITNTKTKTVTILDSKVIPIIYQPIQPAVIRPQLPIYALPIKPITPVFIRPALPVQVIPTPALPIAIRKYPQIKEIVSSVQTTEGKEVVIKQVSVEQFTSVKKYTAVTQTTEGKTQMVYVFDKEKSEVKLIQTVPIPVKVIPVFVETKTNEKGEEVTTSTSVQQVVVKVPEVQILVEELKKKYNVDVTTATKVVEIKGTTVKEIKIVVETEKKTEIVYTAIANGTVVQVVDVQDAPEKIIKPIIPVKPKVSDIPIVVKPEIKKPIEEVIFSHPIIKEQYAESTVEIFKSTETSFVNTYEVKVVNKKGETAVIQLIQEPGQPIQIVHIDGKPTEVVEVSEEPISTEVIVAPKTGNKIITTTDRQVIKTETTIRHVTQNIYAKLPTLYGYVPIKADSITYGVSKETTIVFATEGKTSVQVTVIYDSNTNKVQIVNTQPIKPEEKPRIQTIPGSIVNVVSKKFVEINAMITTIQTSMEGTVTVEELQVKDLDQVKIYTPIIYNPITPEEKSQFVFVYNKGTKEIKQIEKIILSKEVKTVTYSKTVDKFGQTVTQTNDVEMVKEEKPEIKGIIAEIDKTYGQTVSQEIKTVKITEQKHSIEYQIVTEVKGTLQEVKVVKQNGVVTVVGMEETQTPTSEPEVAEKPEEEEQATVETGGEAGNMVTEVINTSDVVSLKDVEIISIKSTETLVTTLYTVETKTKTNEVQIVTISVAPEEKPQIIQIEPIKEPVKEVIVSESKKEKKVSQITGAVITVTTEVKEVKEQANSYTSQIIKIVPEVKEYTPVSIKTTQSGEVSWTTIVYSGEEKSIQVTSLYNKTDNTVKVIDKKPLNKTVETGSQNVPETQIYVIPAVAITSTSKKLTEIATILKEVSTTYKESEISSIEIEVFGQAEKVITVVQTPSGKVNLQYLVNKTTKEVKLIETVNVIETKEEFYSQTINKYGESTIITNNVTQITTKIPEVEGGIQYIKNKYPVVIDKEVKIVKVIEYEEQYQVNYVSQVQTENPLAIVISIDKQTGTTHEITTYTKEDLEAQSGQISVQIEPVKEQVQVDAPEVITVVQYIEQIPEVPIKKIQNVTKVEKIITVFGTQVITIEATSTQNQQIKTVVNYNPITEEVTVDSFDIVAQPIVVKDVVTEFKVDITTGAKQTVTNNPTVLASSEMMKTITEQVKIVDVKLTDTVMTASTTTEYPEKVKVVSIFTNETTKQSVQVVSIFDKETSKVQILEIDEDITTPIPDIPKQVFSTDQLPAAETTKHSIPATTLFIQEKYPQYQTKKPVTVIVQTLEQVEFVSYIYETVTVKDQIVVVYNKTSKESKIVEANPVAEDIKPFFYEEKKNKKGEDIIVTNNLTEVKERIPETQILTTYLNEQTTVTVETIETVELTVSEQYLEYTLVVKTQEGVKQYEYLVDSQTKEVKEVDVQVVSEEMPVLIPKKPVIKVVDPTDEDVKPVVIEVIENPDTKLNNVKEISNVTKETVSKGTKYQIQYITQEEQVNKIIVLEDSDKKVQIIDELPIKKDETPKKPIIIKDQIDQTTKTQTTVYPTIDAFKLDEASEEVTNYLYKAVSETSEYQIQSIRKESFGHVQEYEILLKADKKAPIQVTIAKDAKNKNIVVLEKKKITEDEVQSVLDGSSEPPATVEVSDIEKENIKVLSKLGLVKDIKEYSEVKLQQMANNEQFTTAIESVKQAYSAILSTAVIVRILEKKSLESNNVKVFYKAKDQIYQASLEMNEITGQTKLTEFIKVGTQSYPKSEVNVYSDLCYGYQLIQDFSLDGNLDFITTFLKQKHDSLKDASLIEAQEIILQNGRINYKLYYKKDASTVKYIVYYEPEYKRVLEVRGTSFEIGDKYTFVEKSKQISDPYFRKLDTYIRQNRDNLGAASVMHTESKDDGQKIQFRTVYTTEGKTYRSIASINKDNQNIEESSLSQVIEVPVEESYESSSQCSTQTAKLDIHDLGKNTYFTECYKYIQDNFQKELDSGQLLGASQKTNYNIYTYVFYFIVDETKIITLTVQFDPLSQAINVSSQPSNIDLQDGYYPIRSDKKLTQVRNWLKDNNPDLSSSVLISSMAKKFYFGTLYKIVFKVTTKYIVYIAYVECGSKEVKIYDTQQLDSYTASPVSQVQVDNGFVGPSGGDEPMILGGDQGIMPPSGGDVEVLLPLGGDSASVGMETKLKGFARPTSA